MHPSEERLQQFVLDPSACPQEEIDHVADCPHCRALVTMYSFLTKELDRLPASTFDFDLAAAVMEQVLAAEAPAVGGVRAVERGPAVGGALAVEGAPAVQQRKSGMAAMWTVIILAIGIPAWLFRRSAYFVFTDMSPDFYLVILVTAAIVIGLFILRLQRRYRDVINLINK